MGWMGMGKKPGGSGGGLPNVEATLERIVSNAAAENQFDLYKLVNYRRGGTIVDAYANLLGCDGGSRLDRLCSEQLSKCMYREGRGLTISTAECLNWRNRHIGEVSIPMSGKKSSSFKWRSKNLKLRNNNESKDLSASVSAGYASGTVAPYEAPEDHLACWMLDKRGALGENPLHVLVICDTPMHTCVAKVLLQHFPKLALDIIEGGEYYGLSPLHLAVAYNNMELVQAFVQAGANVNERAVGRFFMPTDQQLRMKKNTTYAGLSYLGEYPLSWAACSENEAIYNYLLDHGADPNLQDFFGNMILHMVVISNKLGMYGYALRHPKKPANNELLNKVGLTPLTLACTLGRNKIFREMLELSAVEFWRFCNVTCSAYPLIALDSIRPDGGTNWKSALMIILNGETDEHLDMLEGGVVQRLLEDKWKTFARMQFLKRLAVLVLHLMVISIAVYLRPFFTEELAWNMDAKIMIRYSAELGALLGCGNFVILQQGSEIRSQGIKGFLANMTRSPAKFVFLLSNICMILCVPCRILGLRLIEDTLLIFALPGSWFFLMFFAGAVRLTGPFVTMIYSMIAGDMVRFGIIYLIILLGFSQAFFFLFKTCYVGVQDQDDTNVDMYNTYYGTWMALYHMTLGSYQYADFSKPKYAGLTLGIFVIFMVMVPILLLNMLIAMMGNTYANVISKSEKEFVKQWAKIVLALERSVVKDKAKEYLNSYAINLGPPPEPGGLQMKGVMAINCKLKTKAQQRKGAFLNWRRMGKKCIKEMRKYNCRGDQLLAKLTQVAASTKVSRRGSFPRILGEELDAELEGQESSAPRKSVGGFHEALAQLAFAHDLNLDPPPMTRTNTLKASSTKLNEVDNEIIKDQINCDITTRTALRRVRSTPTPPPPYQNVSRVTSGTTAARSLIGGDIASVAFMAVQATSIERPKSALERLVEKSSTERLSEDTLSMQTDGIKSTEESQRHVVTEEIDVDPLAKSNSHLESSEADVHRSSSPSVFYEPQSPSFGYMRSVVLAAGAESAPTPSEDPQPEQALHQHLKSAPSTSRHVSYSTKPDVLVLPSKLSRDVRATSAAAFVTPSTTTPRARKKVRIKTRHRHKAGLPSTGLRMLANRVGAMAPTPVQLVSTIDRPSHHTSSSKILPPLHSPAGAPGTSTASFQSQSTLNPMARWSTKSLLSLTSLVAWDEGNDESSSSEEPAT